MKKTIIGIFLYASVLAFLTWIDLPLSLEFANPGNSFGVLGERIAMAPGILVAVICCAILYHVNEGKIKYVWLVLSMVASFLVAYYYYHYAKQPFDVIFVLACVIIESFGLYSTTFVDKTNIPFVKRVCYVGILTLLISTIVVNGIKPFWGRPRFRAMDNPLEEFKPWYIINGFVKTDSLKSFPSGHTQSGSVIIWFTLLPVLFSKLKNTKTLWLVVSVIWIVFVMMARISAGAHFATDVYVGCTVTVVTFLVLKKKLLKEIM